MKRRLATIITAIALAFSILAIPVALPDTAPKAEAGTWNFRVDSTSSRGIWVFNGPNGHGDADFVPPRGYSELAWVSSFRIPARCYGYMNGVRLWGKRSYSRNVEITTFSYWSTFKLKC